MKTNRLTLQLHMNESPFGPSPLSQERMAAAVYETGLYPDCNSSGTEAELARFLRLPDDQILVGPGSASLLQLIANTLYRPGDEVVYATPSFSLYRHCVVRSGATPVEVPLTRAHVHDLPAMLAAITERTRVVIVCNPNNPTGTPVQKAEFDAFMERVPSSVLVVIDEAYFEYAAGPNHRDGLDYLCAGKNVLVLRSFSKCYGMAGLRVGYAMSSPPVIRTLRGGREPFAVNSIAQAAVQGALMDPAYIAKIRSISEHAREQLYRGAQELGVGYIPSVANFVMLNCKCDDTMLVKRLAAAGVLVRSGQEYGMPGWIRVTTGTQEQIGQFLEALAQALYGTLALALNLQSAAAVDFGLSAHEDARIESSAHALEAPARP